MSENFSARSLVGMTQGARKRTVMARIARNVQEWDATGQQYTPDTVAMLVPRYRNIYRIGQRPRPCPGCWQCREDLFGYGGFPGGDPRDFEPDPECTTEAERELYAEHCALAEAGSSPYIGHTAGACDGSGVLLAKTKGDGK